MSYPGRPSSGSSAGGFTRTTATTNGGMLPSSIPYRRAPITWSEPHSSTSDSGKHGVGGGGGGGCARRRGQLDLRFQVRRNPARPKRGRGVFAVEAVPAGTEVLVAKQAAALPRGRYRQAFCRRCLTLLDKSLLIKCRRCEDRFCGKECVIAAAGEGTHEVTCNLVEGLGKDCLERLGRGDNAAATEGEILRLTVECLSRRAAGLSDEEEWIEIDDLVLAEDGEGAVRSAGGGDGDAGLGMLEEGVIRDAQARLKAAGLEVSVEEIQTVHRRCERRTVAAVGCFHRSVPRQLC